MPLKIEPAIIENIEKAVNNWIELLAQEKYAEAYDLTLHDPYYKWSPAIIESVINGYGSLYDPAEEKCRVTSPLTATHENTLNPYKEIHIFDSPSANVKRLPDMLTVGHATFDLPINGEWSDLSATFTIFKGSNFFMLELNEIHVL